MRIARCIPKLGVLPLLVLVGCSEPPLPPLDLQEGCNPLASEWDCLLPYPSDVFTVADAALPSGRRLSIPDPAILRTSAGDRVDFTALHPADGFSHLPQILALFPGGIDDSELVFLTDDVTTSLGDRSPTVLLDAERGERILHFAETDPRAPSDARRALFLRPLVRLRNGTRHVVAVRGLRDRQGRPLDPPEAFRRLRDGQAAGDPVLEPLARRYEAEVFPVLSAAGIARDELLLAWDFTTQSEDQVTGDLFAIRDDAVERLTTQPPAVRIVSVEALPEGPILQRVRGTIEVPLYLEGLQPGALLDRDAAGRPVARTRAEIPFVALVPRGLASPARALQYAHGFFGTRDELDPEGFPGEFLARTGMVGFAVDWWGLSRADSVVVGGDLIEDLSIAFRFTDRVHQAMVNQIALGLAIAGPLSELEAFQSAGQPLYDPGVLYFYGISAGHILGGTYLALSPQVERAALSVGGAGLAFMMFRADPFQSLLGLIEVNIQDALDQRKLVTLASTVIDRIDPITYAPFVRRGRTATDPATREILMHVGLGDPSVPNAASHLHARALGLPYLLPAPRAIPGLGSAEGPLASGLVEFDFGVAEPLPGTFSDITPSAGNPVHTGVRSLEASMAQVDAFFRPGGRIEATCAGPCDPE